MRAETWHGLCNYLHMNNQTDYQPKSIGSVMAEVGLEAQPEYADWGMGSYLGAPVRELCKAYAKMVKLGVEDNALKVLVEERINQIHEG